VARDESLTQTAPSPEIRFRALGSAELQGPDDPAAAAILQRPKLLALLSYLAAVPARFHRRDTLLGLFWAEMDQERARAALRQSLYYLRKSLGDGVVVSRGGEEVGLAVDRVWCDVAAFDEAVARGAREEALEIYRGDLLDGFFLAGAPEFERWLEQRRDELRRRARQTAWELAQQARDPANVGAAAHWARQALRFSRHDEGLLRDVMELLDRIGDRAGAIREYEVFARRLREDLDLAPSPETRALVDDLRSRDTVATPQPASGPGNGTQPRAPIARGEASVQSLGTGAVADAPLEGTARGVGGEPPPTSVAVLPFLNMSPDPENEYLSDGIAEEITNALTKVKALQVASRTSAFAFKGRGVDVRRIGEELEVATVLEGSVRKAGSRLRITAQLVKAATGYHLWSERYDRETEDVFAIQDEIAQSVVSALKVILTDRERQALVRMPTSDVRAYEYYLRGRHYLHQTRKRSLEYAREMFTQAIAVDPEFALAHAGIADCSSLLHMYYPSAEAAVEQAERASRRAVELDPDLPEARAARGFALSQQRRYDEAAAEFLTAVRLDPGQFDARYYYARQCFQRGALPEAATWFEDAARVREDYQARFFAAQSYEAMGERQRALAAYQRALDVARRHLELHPDDPRAATMRAVASCRTGDREGGLRWAERALVIDPEDAGVRYNVACLYALEGERDRAIATLEECVQLGFGNLEWIAQDPDMASLRNDPRFRRLIGQA
jgi:adenylate cyclase